jgi:uncharacterized membrane protein YraQ (UPF0718 family)
VIEWKREGKYLFWMIAIFVALFYLPVGTPRFDNAVMESFHLVKWYAQEHVLLCLIPAFFIAGAIAVFVSQGSVMKYLGAKANRFMAYGVASVSGTILAVCSCTVLPLFAGIYRMGAGLGPATAFLYSGPAINVLAIVMTARILGPQLGIARAVGAILFSVIIGLAMHFIFRREEAEKSAAQMAMADSEEPSRPLWQNGLFFALMVLILVFANWGAPQQQSGVWYQIHHAKWLITSLAATGFGVVLGMWFGVNWIKLAVVAIAIALFAFFFPTQPLIPFSAGVVGLSVLLTQQEGENQEWFASTWGFAKQIMPLLLFGVLIAGLLLGRVGEEGLIPSQWIAQAVGGNSFMANFFASFAGAFMYFATLTEVPILQGLIGNGMGKGPALALLLAGPALSLPNMLVIRSVMGTRKTVVFVALVVAMATLSGMVFGAFAG